MPSDIMFHMMSKACPCSSLTAFGVALPSAKIRSGRAEGSYVWQAWADLVHRIMEQDWSWSEPALDYIELYYKAIKR